MLKSVFYFVGFWKTPNIWSYWRQRRQFNKISVLNIHTCNTGTSHTHTHMWDPARWISNLGDLLGLSESSDLEKASLALWLMRCGSTRLVCVKTSVSLCVRVINVDAAPREKKKKKKSCVMIPTQKEADVETTLVCASLSICWSSFYDISCLTFGFSAGIVWLLIQNESYILRDQDYVFKSTGSRG